MEPKKLHRKALILSYITVVYNLLEGSLSIFAGILANSTSLIGFALDSFIESLSGFIMIWRFSNTSHLDKQATDKIEKIAEKLVGITFLILGLYVLIESIEKLITKDPADPSLFGIIIAIVSIFSMPVLFYLKFKTAKTLNSKSLLADAKETLVCSLLSIVLLIGLLMNYMFSFWQADPVAALIIVLYLFKEGVEIIRE
jgi:cation diffusion facilitator family transporter